MKFKKRCFAIALAALLVMSASACGGSKEEKATEKPSTTTEKPVDATTATETAANTQEVENKTEEPTKDPDEPVIQDMGGYTFIVADIDQNRWEPKEGSSDLANATLARNQWLEDTFKVDIQYKPHTQDDLTTAVLAGDKYADIFICNTWEIGRHVGAKRILDINTVPNLDLNAKIWTDYNNSNLLAYNGKIYGVGAPFASQSDEVWGVYFNKAIIEELKLESPYELMKQDKWNFETFLEYERAAQRDLNGDGVLDFNDRFGFATGHDWDIGPVMYLASGNHIIAQDGGKLSYGVNTPQAFEAIEMIKKMIKKGDTFYPKEDGTDMDAYVKAFSEGKALFLAYSNGNSAINPIFEMTDDFGFVPMPKGPNATDYLCWVSHNAPSLAIPITNKDLEKTGAIMSALAWKAQDADKIRLDEIAYTRFRDDESVETVKNLNKWGTSDLCFIGQQINGDIYQGLGIVPAVCFFEQDREIASAVDEVLDKFNIGLEEFVQKMDGTYVEPEPTEEPPVETTGE